MTKERQELILQLDWDIIDAGKGFTFDMGGSVMKVAFVDKNDYIEPNKREPNSRGSLHLVNFSRAELDEGFQFIAEKARVLKSESGEMPQIYSTGFGGTQFKKKLMDTIKVRNKQLMEFDCFNECFMYIMKNMPRREIVYPVYKPAFEVIRKKRELFIKRMSAMKSTSEIMDRAIGSCEKEIEFEQLQEHDLDKPMIEMNGLFPCGIMMCGTGFGFSRVEADGTSRILGTTMRGGRTILGEGFLLTGAKTYEEFMEIAEQGDAIHVSTTNTEIMQETPTEDVDDDDDDVYLQLAKTHASQNIPEEVALYFGKVTDGKTKDDFRREDIARAMLETRIGDVVQMTIDRAVSNGIKHVFFCGGFVNHPLIREIFTYEWLRYIHLSPLQSEMKAEPQLHFLIHGQSMGAIGALLNHKYKWSEQNKAKMEKKKSEKN